MQAATSIELHFRADDFRELYYANGKSNIFTWQYTQKEMIYAGSFAMAAILFYLMADKSASISSIMFLLFSLGLMVIFLVRLIININRFTDWKRSIETWLKEYTKYQKYQLVLGEVCLEFIQDDKVFIENWITIKAADLNELFISVTGHHEQYVFPAKSMQPAEFEFLRNFVQDKLRNSILELATIEEAATK